MAFFRPMAAGHHAGHAAGLWHDAGQDAGRVEARPTATWTNAPLVRSARGAGGAPPPAAKPEPGRSD